MTHRVKVERTVKDLIEDTAKIGRAVRGVLFGFSAKGRLYKAVSVSRPNWPESFCCKATNYLVKKGVKGPFQFTGKMDYLSYLDKQLTRYAADYPVVKTFPVTDEVGLKRWEQRWEMSRRCYESTEQIYDTEGERNVA